MIIKSPMDAKRHKRLVREINFKTPQSKTGKQDRCPGYLTHPFDILGFSMQILSEVGSVY